MRVPAAAAPQADLSFAPDAQIDGFRIRRLVGEGAMGQVYLAQDLALGRRVALKFVRPDYLGATGVERFLEEARTTAQFSHPNIVTLHSVGTYNGAPYLALEYLDGETLRQRMTRGRLGTVEALRICRAIAEALAEAHRHGIIHADLKPENVFLPVDGRVRVLDFGLARHAGAEQTMASGTPAYMAPERWRGAAPSPGMDVWALGILLFELLEGRRPLEDAQLAKFAFHPWVLLPSPRLVELPGSTPLLTALATDPDARPTAEAMALCLTELLEPGGARVEGRSPFRGLRPFSETDAGDFFGREADVDAFVERLRVEGLVPLVGPSGVGKSSFLHAGVIPRLRQMDGWTVLHARPGAKPLGRIAAAVLPAAGMARTAQELAQALAERPGELILALREAVRLSNGPVLLAVDAFEEAFTLAPPGEAEKLAACLAAAASADDRWRIVLGLRDDYLGHLARLEPLRRSLGAAYVLGPLTPSALEAAVIRPLRRVGYGADDPALPARIASDVQSELAGLPLLQFACTALWERRDADRRRVLASVYDAIGGAGGALAAHAQQTLQHLLAEEVRIARALLLRLVTPNGTRRPMAQTDLLEGLDPRAADVLQKLLSNRLLAIARDAQTDDAYVELAHESLIKAWPELARWIDETREERALVQEVEQAAQLWERRGRRDEETWPDDAVTQAVRKVREWSVALPTVSRAFLEAGAARARRQAWKRRALMGGVIVTLGAVATTATLAAIAFRDKQLEAIEQQEKIRLASADIGIFDLVLQTYAFDRAARTWRAVPAERPPRWTLAPFSDGQAPERAAPYGAELLKQEAPARLEDGGWRTRAEAPARSAWLTVERPGCSPSILRLRHLPGYSDRDVAQPEEIRVAIPDCASSHGDLVTIPAGPFYARDHAGQDVERVLPAFRFDRHETTNALFSLFGDQVLPLLGEQRVVLDYEEEDYVGMNHLDAPVSFVSAFSAEEFCRYMGKAVPTVLEWQKAFRGGTTLDASGTVNPWPKRMSPWDPGEKGIPANLRGDDPYPGLAPVGSFPRDRSPYGILDLAGNAQEWTADDETEGDFKGFRMILGGMSMSPTTLDHHTVAWVNHYPAQQISFGSTIRCVDRTVR